MKKVVLIRCPQALLKSDVGELFSPNRSTTPEPTLPQLEGILRDFSETNGRPMEVAQIDLRDGFHGKVKTIHYGDLQLPYLKFPLRKVYDGVSVETIRDQLEDADFIGVTSNFAMSRGIVCRYLKQIRAICPKTEIWLGGRDVYTDRVKRVYANAVNNRNLVFFEGHVFMSLPAYLAWNLNQQGQPFGVEIYDAEGKITIFPSRSLTEFANKDGEIDMPLPIYPRPEVLDIFKSSSEGHACLQYDRFVHMTVTIGCPHACGYCTTGYRERFLVRKSIQTIHRELELYRRLGVTDLGYMDDNPLALGVETITDIMREINQYDFQIEYGNGLQLSRLLQNWDALREPVLGNCKTLYAPLEDLTRNRFYKKLDPTNSQLELMRRLATETPPTLKYVTMGVIVGVPGHTKKALETTLPDNIRKLLNVFAGTRLEVAMTVFAFIPLSGSPFGERAINSGRMVADPIREHPEISNFGTVSYAPDGMTHAEVWSAYQNALEINPAGKELGLSYLQLQRLGEMALPANERWKIPHQWRTPGLHLRARVP